MKIVLTGGGSGGHITPILAVAHELKLLQPDIELIYVGHRGDNLADIPAESNDINAVYAVDAGKLRRYHGEGFRQLLDAKTVAFNLRDVMRTLRGCWQGYRLLKQLRPDCVFVKGGFVGVPIGLAAARLHIPYVTHDSDAIPGLANRIIARWASLHAVALPKEVYQYPEAKTRTVGVPVHANYEPIDEAKQAVFRHEIGLDSFAKILFVTGGGLGAQRLNDAVATVAPKLLTAFPDLAIVQSVGRHNETDITERYARTLTPEQRARVVVKGYMTDMYRYSGAADVIVTRAGATTLAEFAIQRKACVVVPNPILTSGHQLKNAAYLEAQGAIELVHEGAVAYDLQTAITNLLNDTSKRRALAEKLAAFAVPDAAKQLAMVLLEQANR